MRALPIWLAAVAFAGLSATGAQARPLKLVQDTGFIGLCANPNALPFSSKTAKPSGFELELGAAIAEQLHVRLEPDWVITASQMPRAECDLLLDVIADQEAQSGNGLKFSKPYYRNGVTLVVPKDSKINGFAALDGTTKVGVPVSSVTGMVLGERGVKISIFGYEEDMINAVASGEIAAAAVTPVFSGWYLHQHPELNLTLLPVDDSEPRFSWNIAVGMRKPDPALRAAIDAAVENLSANGTIARIYASYGITLPMPK
jgi:polar amino acid transport system substrate-binding protein